MEPGCMIQRGRAGGEGCCRGGAPAHALPLFLSGPRPRTKECVQTFAMCHTVLTGERALLICPVQRRVPSGLEAVELPDGCTGTADALDNQR